MKHIKAAREIGFTTHAMHPASVVALCNELYAKHPTCYLLEICGFSWEIDEGLSDKAQMHLQQVIDFIVPILMSSDPKKKLSLASEDRDTKC